MVLPYHDGKHFIKLYHLLLFYINDKYRVLENLHHPDDFFKLSPDDILKLKDKLYDAPNQIDSFVRDNPANLASEDLKIISSWRHFKRGRFCVVRYLKNYTVFLDEGHPAKAYGVQELAVPWEKMLGSNLPRMVEATLLPFKENIIFDGTFTSYNLYFGSGMRRSINDTFRQAKTNYGIITSLPFSSEKSISTDSEKLRGFLRSQDSRDIHWEEIEELKNKSPELMAVFSEEMGRVHARVYRKKLKEIGIKEGWFGLIDGIIIAGGGTREDVETALKSLMPRDMLELAYIFQLKAK
jgi:hypothetical protein